MKIEFEVNYSFNLMMVAKTLSMVHLVFCSESAGTSVVVFCTVTKVILLLQDKLGQHKVISHLHWGFIQPLKYQIIHSVANYTKRKRERVMGVQKRNETRKCSCFKCHVLQLSSCIVQVCMSIGKFFRSIGHDRIRVSLKKE